MRSALLGSIAAVTAVVTAVVFSASLGGLTAHPARYGWDWDLVIQAEAGYGYFAPGVMNKLLKDAAAVTGWSEFGFPAGRPGRHPRARPPPARRGHRATSGRALSVPDQIELGR